MAGLIGGSTIVGDEGDDLLQGGDAAEVITGAEGADTLLGLAGDDTLIGGAGRDVLDGGAGRDVLYGGAGRDFLRFDARADADGVQRLFGGAGDDVLRLSFALEGYALAAEAEILAYHQALLAGQDPGAGGEFAFQTFALRAAGIEEVRLFVDGRRIEPGAPPAGAATADAITTGDAAAVSGDVLANDGATPFSIVTLQDDVAEGTLEFGPDGAFTYTPAEAARALSAGETLTQSFTYLFQDGFGRSSTAAATITILGVNEAPTAAAVAATVAEDGATTLNLLALSGATDVDASDVLTIAAIDGGPVGAGATAITLASGAVATAAPGGAFTYAPAGAFASLAPGETATDVVVFTISDGQGGLFNAPLTVTVTGVATEPVTAPDGLAAIEDGGPVQTDVGLNDIDPEGGALSFALVGTDPGFLGGLDEPADGVFRFDPGAAVDRRSAGQTVTQGFVYRAPAAPGRTRDERVTIIITGANDDPTGGALTATIGEDGIFTANAIADSGADDVDELDVLSVSAVDGFALSGADVGVLLASGAGVVVGADGALRYDPNGAFDTLLTGETAVDSFTVTITDGPLALIGGPGGFADVTVTVTIEGETDAPVAVTDMAVASEDEDIFIPVLANDQDPDGAGLTIVDVDDTGDNGGAAFIEGDEILFGTNGDFDDLNIGDERVTAFTYTMESAAGLRDTATVEVTVTGENDAPIAASIETTGVTEQLTAFSLDLNTGHIDVDEGAVLTVANLQEVGTNFGGTLTGTVFSIDPRIFSFLNGGQQQVVDYTFDVIDEHGATAQGTYRLVIDGVSDALAVNSDSFTVTEDAVLSGDVTLNDSFTPPADINLIDGPAGGDLLFNDDGTFTFTPGADFQRLAFDDSETVSFTYEIAETLDSGVATVEIEIFGLNDAPAPFVGAVADVDIASANFAADDGAAADSANAAFDPSGAFVAFDSFAADLVEDDANGFTDVFLRDLDLGQTRRVSLAADPVDDRPLGESFRPDVTADQRVLFLSRADDIAGPQPFLAAFLTDPALEFTEVVSVSTGGVSANAEVTAALISDDGRFVAMESGATNLDQSDVNGPLTDVFLRDLETGETVIVSQPGGVAPAESRLEALSADGGTVIFSTVNPLVAADVNGVADIYALDRQSGEVELISVNSAGEVADGPLGVSGSALASVSANGRYVAFASNADNLDGAPSGVTDIYVRDRVFNSTERITLTAEGANADRQSFSPMISDDGRYVAYSSLATNLDAANADANGLPDVFHHDRLTGETIRASAIADPDGVVEPGGFASAISADGARVAIRSTTEGGDFVEGVTPGRDQIYVVDIDRPGFFLTDADGVQVLDLTTVVGDVDGDDILISDVDVFTDESDLLIDFTLSGSGDLGVFLPEVEIDFGQFAFLGAGDTALMTVSFMVSDGVGGDAEALVGVTVTGVNDAPTADDASFQVEAGETLSGSFFARDPDSETLTFSVVSPPSGDFTLNPDGGFSYIPDAAAAVIGDNTFEVMVDDGEGGVATFDATITVNASPMFLGAPGALVALRNQPNMIDLNTLFTDPDGGGLLFSAEQTSGAPIFGLTLDPLTGILSGAPNAARVDRIAITATDEDGGAATAEAWLAYVEETVIGDAADSELTGALNATLFDGGPGDDLILAGADFDVFVYDFAEDGFDQIVDDTTGADSVLLLEGAEDGDLSFTRLGIADNLLITLAGDEFDFEAGLVVTDALAGNRLGSIGFSDGTLVDLAEIRAEILATEATAGDDFLRGFTSADILDGGAGDDTLMGRDGADTYVITPGLGFSIIQDNGFFDDDVVRISGLIGDAAFARGPDDDDLTITFTNGGGVTLQGVLAGAQGSQVEIYEFTDQTLAIAEIRQILTDQQVTEGDDVVTGFATGAGEILEGGLGDDTLIGRGGDDVYIYGAGDGDDVIEENGFFNTDVLQINDFTLDFDAATGRVDPMSEVQFRRAPENDDDLIVLLDNGVSTGSIRVKNALNTDSNDNIESFSFPGQTLTLSAGQIRAELIGRDIDAGAAHLRGFDRAETIEIDPLTEIASGLQGADTYIYEEADGEVLIVEQGFFSNDRLIFADLDFADLRFDAVDHVGRDIRITTVAPSGVDVTVRAGLSDSTNQRIEIFEDMDGDELTSAEIQTLITAQEAAEGRPEVTGGLAADAMPTTIGFDAILRGLDAADAYTYVFRDGGGVRVNDGADRIIETNVFQNDEVVIQGLTVADVTGGEVDIFVDSARTEVRFEFGMGDSLILQNTSLTAGRIERIVFDDQIFDEDEDDADGGLSFENFLAANAIVSTDVTGTGENDLFDTALTDPENEVYRGGGGNDTIILRSSRIGDDVVAGNGVTGAYELIIDFSDYVGQLGVSDVLFSRAPGSPDDLQIDIIGDDTADIGVVTGRFEERVVVQNVFSSNNQLTQITIERPVTPTETLTVEDIVADVISAAATPGDDVIDGSFLDDVFIGGPGDDVIAASRGDDVMFFSAGDGRDLILESNINGGSADRLRIFDLALADLTLRRGALDDDQLVLDFGDDEITLDFGFGAGNAGIDQIDIVNDSFSVSREELIEVYLDQVESEQRPQVIGSGFDDMLTATAGTRFMSGRGGDDGYFLTGAASQDITIQDAGDGVDLINLGVDLDDVDFRLDPLDAANLIVDFAQGGSLTVLRTFTAAAANRIEFFETIGAGATTFGIDEVRQFAVDGAATSGADLIQGTALEDVLRALVGDDTLMGGDGADIYEYAAGGGDVVIEDTGGGDVDVLSISGVDEADVTFARDARVQGGDLVLTFAGLDGSVRVLSSLTEGDNTRIDQILFADNATTVTIEEAAARALSAETGARVTGLAATDDVLTSNPGVTVLDGDSGNDTYVFNAGDGVLIVNDTALSTNPAVTQNLVVNGLASSAADLSRLSRNSESFVITFDGANDRIIVVGARFAAENALGVESIFFSLDGVTLDEAAINTRLNGFGPISRVAPEPFEESEDEVVAEVSPIAIMNGDGTGEALAGDDGRDRIFAAGGDDTVLGGGGDDTIRGQAGEDLLHGEAGADRLYGGAGADEAHGGAGRDLIKGGGGDDEIYGGHARDTLKGGAGDDSLRGERGADMLVGGGGADDLKGGAGGDVLFGGGGADRLSGGTGWDEIFGGAGADTALGGAGRDLIEGAGGADVLRGGAGADTISGDGDGQSGADRLLGGRGADELSGGGGGDILRGGAGADTLEGGAGADILMGGRGADVFIFSEGFAGALSDELRDFEDGVDLLDFRGAGATSFDDLTVALVGEDALIFVTASTGAGAEEDPIGVLVIGVDAGDLTAADFIF